MRNPVNIIVLGGGFAGLESAFYIKMKLGDKGKITLISDKDYFLFKPNTIYIPFGLNPEKLKISLDKPMKHKGIELINSPVSEVDLDRKNVRAGNAEIRYDFLLIATGAGMRPQEIPGLPEYAQTIWTPEEMLLLRSAYQKLIQEVKDGLKRRILFVVPPQNKCAGPLYEMALMLDTWLRRFDVRNSVEIVWTTYEESFIQAFGPRLHEVVAGEFSRREIHGFVKRSVSRVEPGKAFYQNGETFPFDLLVSFPPYVASRSFPGLPSDDRGFIQTEFSTRQVVGHPDVYAVGDAGDFPVKQAFLAFLQADTVADHLASRILGTKASLPYTPISMCVMEQFNKATFAQVPLRMTGVPAKPIEVAQDSLAFYRVGTSPIWRLGKKLLGVYLPWRFKAGNPFHAGLPWKGMEIGLKVMSRWLAD